MNSYDRSESAMPAVNPITRRDFMKKTALTAGAITLLGQGIGFANPSSVHCPAHGDYCTYISNITVTFTRADTNIPDNPDYQKSGRRFYGTLTYVSYWCKTGATTNRSFPVHSGGHRDPDSAITQGHDTTCPGGIWDTTPDSTGHVGFPMDTTNTNPQRSEIQIHGPDTTTGCIAFDDQGQYNTFAPEIRCNNFTNCVHNPPNPVKVEVKYVGVTPNWDGPLTP